MASEHIDGIEILIVFTQFVLSSENWAADYVFVPFKTKPRHKIIIVVQMVQKKTRKRLAGRFPVYSLA